MLVFHPFVVDMVPVMVTKDPSIVPQGFVFSFNFVILHFYFFT